MRFNPFRRRAGSHTTRHQEELLGSLFLMAWFVEARDPYTGGHLWRVSRYSQLLAEAAGLSSAAVARVGLGGFLHDLGKIGIPDSILGKPGALTDEEYTLIRTHTDIGLRMISAHPLAALVRDVIHLHHERVDGGGYPLGLSGTAIPLEARIVGLCDAFDAMTSARPYRQAMGMDDALHIIDRMRGRQFDADLAERFLSLGSDGMLDHIQGHSDEGIRLQDCPMCGPTLVMVRENRAGDHIYCRSCAGDFVLEQDDTGGLTAVPTGGVGSARDLEPEADEVLIRRAIHQSLSMMPVDELIQRSAR